MILELDQIVKSYPPHIQYPTNPQWFQKPTSVSDRDSPRGMYIITRIHLDILQCRFLLQRLLISKGFCGGQELFDISNQMVTTVLSFWSNRDYLQNLLYGFDWIVRLLPPFIPSRVSISNAILQIIAYGIPSIGILCIELLRASGLATPLASTINGNTATYPPVQLSRSDIVQTLTLFISFLDWIRPTDNNAHLYVKFRKVVKRIIDIVFDPPPPKLNHASAQDQQLEKDVEMKPGDQIGGNGENGMMMGMGETEGLEGDFDPALMLMDDLDWLNTVDWTEGHWS